MLLTKAERNSLIEVLQGMDLNPRDFALSATGGNSVLIKHSSSDSWFRIDEGPEPYMTGQMRIGDGPVVSLELISNVQEVRTLFAGWARDAHADTEIPDLWAELSREQELLSGTADERVADRPFTPQELAQIPGLLGEVRDLIIESHPLTADQQTTLEGRLRYLEEAAGRMNRFDWRNALLGALFGLGLEAVVPPDAIRAVMPVLAESLGKLFGLEIPQLPSG